MDGCDTDTRMFKKKLLLWVTSWLEEDQQAAKDEETIVTPDLVDIARLLQAAGFKISYMDRSNPTEICQISEYPRDHPACRVSLMCPNSGVKIELEAPTSTCTCSASSSIFNHNWTAGEKNEDMMNFIAPKPSPETSKNVSQVIRALLQLNGSFPDINQNDYKCQTYSPIGGAEASSSMKTPATGIAVVTPNAPCIPKLTEKDANCSVIPGRYRSLDTLIAAKDSSDDLPEPGPLTPKDEENFNSGMGMDVDCDLNATIIHTSDSGKKQFISRSSPALNCSVQTFQRSDTFIFEEAERDLTLEKDEKKTMMIRSDTFDFSGDLIENSEDEKIRTDPPRKTLSPLRPLPQVLALEKLHDVRQMVGDIISLLAGTKLNWDSNVNVPKASEGNAHNAQQKTLNNVRPIRCLSDFSGLRNPVRNVNPGVSSIPRPNFSRRISSTMPIISGTPTTSRRSTTASGGVRIKSASTTALLTAGTAGRISTTDTDGQASRLVSPGTRSTSVKRGPSPSSTILNLAPKDKEARLNAPRSKFTIPRLSIGKK